VGDLAQQFGRRNAFPHCSAQRRVRDDHHHDGPFLDGAVRGTHIRPRRYERGEACDWDAIATGSVPPDVARDGSAYNFIDELSLRHQVTDATFKAAKETYGEKGVVDMMV